MVWQSVKEKENSEFKAVKLYLKNDLVSLPAHLEGLVNTKSTDEWEKALYECIYIYQPLRLGRMWHKVNF